MFVNVFLLLLFVVIIYHIFKSNYTSSYRLNYIPGYCVDPYSTGKYHICYYVGKDLDDSFFEITDIATRKHKYIKLHERKYRVLFYNLRFKNNKGIDAEVDKIKLK